SKEFDSIDHGRLLHKFLDCGISSNALEGLRRYLTERIQAVRIGADRNIAFTSHNDFILFINDLPCIPLKELE
ncbi:Hypothetical predicted protein, partial [Paramuricea clavata]